MRALITGVGGFAGQHLAERLLLSPDVSVVGVSREAVSWRRPSLCADGRVRVLTADIARPDAARHAVGEAEADELYLLAAVSSPVEGFAQPLATLVNNTACVLNVLEAVRELRPAARVLVVSSGEVYGRSPTPGRAVDESAPLAPDNPYAVSKAVQDLLASQYHIAYGLQVVRVRPFNHIGPGQSDRFVAASFARQIAEAEIGRREPVIQVGNLDSARDFSDVRDIVRAYELAVRRGRPGQAYNLSTGRAVPIRSLLEGLIRLSWVPMTVKLDPERLRPADAPSLIGDASQFTAETGWQPQIPLEQTLSDILDDWRVRVRRN